MMSFESCVHHSYHDTGSIKTIFIPIMGKSFLYFVDLSSGTGIIHKWRLRLSELNVFNCFQSG